MQLSSWLPRGGTLSRAEADRRHRGFVITLAVGVVALVPVGAGAHAPAADIVRSALGVALVVVLAALLPATRPVRAAVSALGAMTWAAAMLTLVGDAPTVQFAALVVIPALGLYEEWTAAAVVLSYVLLRFVVVGDPRHLVGLLVATLVSIGMWRVSERARESQRRLHADLDRATQYDELTGLPVRAGLRVLGTEMAPGAQTSLTLALIDLDRFAEVNHTLGHDWGDRVLTELVPRVVRTVRPQDVVARTALDQLAVLLPDATLPFARSIAEAVRREVTTTVELHGVAVDMDASVGIAQWDRPSDGVSPEDAEQVVEGLLRQAEIAMHQARTQLSPTVVYDASLEEHSADRLALLSELGEAIDNRALDVHFQPVIDIETSRVRSVEALVHWDHPTRGLLPPRAFVPVAEATSLNIPLTTLVLDLALAQAAVLADLGHDIQMSVNVSPRTLLAHGFVQDVDDALERHAVPATQLRLEITEAGIHTDPVGARAVLQRLADRGVSVSVDDFGAGFSSLAHLRDLPVDEVKIDQSFVTGLASTAVMSSGGDPLVIRAATLLAHAMGLSVVAKGVESAETLEAVEQLGCDNAQGYHLARPMPPRQLQAFLGPVGISGRGPSSGSPRR